MINKIHPLLLINKIYQLLLQSSNEHSYGHSRPGFSREVYAYTLFVFCFSFVT